MRGNDKALSLSSLLSTFASGSVENVNDRVWSHAHDRGRSGKEEGKATRCRYAAQVDETRVYFHAFHPQQRSAFFTGYNSSYLKCEFGIS